MPCRTIACRIEGKCYLPRGYRVGDDQANLVESMESTIHIKEGYNDLARHAIYILRASNIRVQHSRDVRRTTGSNEKFCFLDTMGWVDMVA